MAELRGPEDAARTSASAGRDAVEAGYVAYYHDVFRYVLALTGSLEESQDIVAEVFERALRAWCPPPRAPLPWLLITARRIATDRWRRARRLAAILLGVRERHRLQVGLERAEFWIWYEDVCRILTRRQREALTLRYQRDLSDADIASVMGLSESGVRSLIARALDVLRSHPEVQ